MRSIRITTGLLLVISAGATMLVLGAYAESFIKARAFERTHERLRAQAHLGALVLEDPTADPGDRIERLARQAGAVVAHIHGHRLAA
ncbi:MAG: hypothetical protein ACOCX2_14730, partial [Armatimonadota bacterium]